MIWLILINQLINLNYQADCGVFWVCMDGKANRWVDIVTETRLILSQWPLHIENGKFVKITLLKQNTHVCIKFESAGWYWSCLRYQCPPGLAYDQESRGCRWADQVEECSNSVITDEEGGQFQCPSKITPGMDCRYKIPYSFLHAKNVTAAALLSDIISAA